MSNLLCCTCYSEFRFEPFLLAAYGTSILLQAKTKCVCIKYFMFSDFIFADFHYFTGYIHEYPTV